MRGLGAALFVGLMGGTFVPTVAHAEEPAEQPAEQASTEATSTTSTTSASLSTILAQPTQATPLAPAGQDHAPRAPEQRYTLGPWIVAAAGATAVVTGFTLMAVAPSTPGNCSRDATRCTALPGESPADLARDQDRAAQARLQPRIGLAIAVGGNVLVLGGLLWHFLEKPASAGKAPTIAPFVTAEGGGVGATGRF